MAEHKNEIYDVKPPRVSMFLFVYQQEEFVEDAVNSLLVQDYNNLQIVISDDASTDNSAVIIEKIIGAYKGPHDVLVNVNPENLGIGNHFKFIMDNLVDGELIVAAAGDDISSSNRVSQIVECWIKNDKPDIIAHDLREFGQDGCDVNSDRTIQYQWQQNPTKVCSLQRLSNYLQNPFPLPFLGAALAYTRALYLNYGSPKWSPDYEDHLMYFRALLGGRMLYLRESLVRYRRHDANFTNRNKKQISTYKQVSLGRNQLSIPMSSFGQYRMHQLLCQQYEDYLKSVQTEKVCLNVEHFFKLWLELKRRHEKLLSSFGGVKGRRALFESYLQSSVKYFSWRWHLGVKKRAGSISYLNKIKVIIFGASTAGQNTFVQLPEQFEVIAFADNNNELTGRKVLGVPVISPIQITTGEYLFDSILVASIYYFPIKQQLVEKLNVPVSKVSRASQALISEPCGTHNYRVKFKVIAGLLGITVCTLLMILTH